MRTGDEQPTPFSQNALASGAVGPAQDAPSEEAALAGALDLPIQVARRTGVVFVHGIGTQAPAETFLDWSGPIVELLTDWRAGQREGADRGAAAATSDDDETDDPVWRAEFAFTAASPPYLEISVPAHEQFPETTWVLTEAWWASDLRAPGLGLVIDYLRRRMRTLVNGITTGYGERRPVLKSLGNWSEVSREGERPPLDWRMIEGLDRVQAWTFGARPVGWVVASAGVVALAGYDVLRRVPFGPVRDFALRRMLDSFLVDWFGDLPVLIDDPVQSANVRARVARSIERLVADGCDAIVIVAHSGGALVSFETLLDPAYLHLPVDKLVTLGQGLGLAWRLAADDEVREIRPGHRLVGNLAKARPGLRWVDVWASYDPAPAGALPARSGIVADEIEAPAGAPTPAAAAAPATPPADAAPPPVAQAVATGPEQEVWLYRADANVEVPTGASPRIVVESRPVTNEMNVMTDHGTYWANPEGFVIPLVRHIDAALGRADDSRFYRDRANRARRIVWRRQRVGMLAAWGWFSTIAAGATVLALIVLQAAGVTRLTAAGDGLAAVWALVPGHELLSAPIDAVGAVVASLLSAVGLDGLAELLGSLGPPFLGVLLVAGLFYVLIKTGAGRWHDWDRRERRAMHPEKPLLPDRSRPMAQALLLLGGGAGLVAACLGSPQIAGLLIGLGAAAGLLVWFTRPFRHEDTAPETSLPAPAPERRKA